MSKTPHTNNVNASRKPKAFSVPQTTDSTDDSSIKRSGTLSSAKNTHKPRTVNSEKYKIKIQSDEAVENHFNSVNSLTPPHILKAPKNTKKFSWFKLSLWALTTLFALGIGLYVDQLIRELFARHEWLGLIASAVTVIFIVSIVALFIREIFNLSRMRSIAKLRNNGDKARQNNDLKLARIVAKDISTLLSDRPQTAKGRAEIAQHLNTVMDGVDLIHIVERDVLAPLDKTAQKMVMASAKRISIVTAVSPRALVDIGFVLYENTKLIRAICELYGGKPSTLGFWTLAKKVISHLAATGAIAIGDGLLQQFIGQGVASKLSARLGEGVVNGLLCARIGISAIDICRPLAFDAEKRPGVSDFLSALTNIKSKKTV